MGHYMGGFGYSSSGAAPNLTHVVIKGIVDLLVVEDDLPMRFWWPGALHAKARQTRRNPCASAMLAKRSRERRPGLGRTIQLAFGCISELEQLKVLIDHWVHFYLVRCKRLGDLPSACTPPHALHLAEQRAVPDVEHHL